ncbi:hypothetical protein AVEN_7011-1 [Araneus ventricosus]|uniref:Histone-lysine N-methyltransferase SETMAR n=1 Tax=Araneus ventricosus TaxID=182803 RepID=A0A4Y2IDJ7_ARAVE|nr:hypothetical protein AVEN_7011-1 [Araneus ventricosus]
MLHTRSFLHFSSPPTFKHVSYLFTRFRIPMLKSSAASSFSNDNARPHTAAAATQEVLDKFGWEFFDYPPYSPDLATCDFHLFLKLKEFLGVKSF